MLLMTDPQPTPASLRRLLPLYVVIFIGFVGYSLMITLFTPMLMDPGSGFLPAETPRGQRTTLLGILLATYPLGQFLGSPVIGTLGDRFGRKPVLLVSLALTTVCYVGIALALEMRSLAALMVACLCAGLSEANVVVAQSSIADVTSKTDRSRWFGYIYLSSSSAYIVGPLAGGKLADPELVSWFTYATPYWVVCLLLGATLAWCALSLHESHPPQADRPIGLFTAVTSLRSVFTNPKRRRLYLVNFLLYLAIFGFFRSYPMYLVDEFHMGVSRLSEFIAYVGLPIVLANAGIVAWLSKRYPPRLLTIGSAWLTGLWMGMIVVPASAGWLWLTLGATAFALAICLPACASLLSGSAADEEQGQVMGSNQSLQVGAEALSGLLSGILAVFVVKLPLLVLAVLAVLGGALLLRRGEPAEAG
jgi:DHA1 family tetracycline resistance protein-like MFS transporter